MLQNRVVKYVVVSFLLIPFMASARTTNIKEHKVVKGDTLWDISKQELKDPFLWPGIWKQNPDIKNPDRIYPGRIIRIPLSSVDQEKSGETSLKASGKVSQENASSEARAKPASEGASVADVSKTSKAQTPSCGQRYRGISGIVLYGGQSIEGDILSMTADCVVIRTKDGTVRSFSFIEEVEEFIKQ